MNKKSFLSNENESFFLWCLWVAAPIRSITYRQTPIGNSTHRYQYPYVQVPTDNSTQSWQKPRIERGKKSFFDRNENESFFFVTSWQQHLQETVPIRRPPQVTVPIGTSTHWYKYPQITAPKVGRNQEQKEQKCFLIKMKTKVFSLSFLGSSTYRKQHLQVELHR